MINNGCESKHIGNLLTLNWPTEQPQLFTHCMTMATKTVFVYMHKEHWPFKFLCKEITSPQILQRPLLCPPFCLLSRHLVPRVSIQGVGRETLGTSTSIWAWTMNDSSSYCLTCQNVLDNYRRSKVGSSLEEGNRGLNFHTFFFMFQISRTAGASSNVPNISA